MIRLTRGTAPLLSRGNSAMLPRRRFAAGTPSSSLRPLLPSGGRRNAAHAASAVLVSVAGATYVRRAAQMEAPPAKESSLMDEFLERMFGTSAARDDEDAASSHSDDRDDESEDGDDGDDVAFTPGRGRPVKVPLDPELVASLPVVPLSRFQTSPSSCRSPDDPLLVTHDGIVYDVSSFAAHHPGGRDLLLTAGGLDLSHFFRNYAVHGRSDKAARWLAPLAVGKLSDDDRRRAERGTTAAVHVERRHRWLGRARRRIVLVAATLPLWMTVRTCVGWVGWWAPGLGRWLARWVPVAVPGLSAGAEPLAVGGSGTHADADKQGDKDTHADNHTDKQKDNHRDSRPTVAVIGGGIAGCGTAWALRRSGFKVTLYEAREEVSGNARTFEWDFSPFRPKAPREDQVVKSCVSVVAWPPLFYKNYMCLLKELNVETMDIPLSWFVNSKVPGAVGTLWAADPTPHEGSLRNVLKKDFDVYEKVVRFSDRVCNLFTMRWAPWRKHDTPSMYDSHQGIGLLNPLNVVPLYSLFRFLGGSDLWWQVVFTPHYTASFLVDELRPFPAVFGPLIEAQIPLLPNPANATSFSSRRSPNDCKLTTCQTWKHAGKGIRRVFDLLTADVDLRENTRVREVQILPDGKKRVHDEYDRHVDVDRVVFACPANAIGNIHKSAGWLANTIFSTFVYADDHHPDSGHMHPVMHSDGTVIDERYRKECLERASNYVEVTRKQDGTINIENQYNFGVQTAGFGVYDLPLEEKPVMLISHALGEGKEIDPKLVRGTANHARAHPLYSGWNVMAMLSLRLIQGKNGIYYCSNWTTPGNCHDMSFLSGLVCAHAIGAKYPFEDAEAEKDFHRLRDLMGF